MTASAPLVRNEHGAILGIDFRRTDLSPIQVPGLVSAQHVMPGDTIARSEGEYVVLSLIAGINCRHAVTRSAGGAEVTFSLGGLVDVVAVGAFDV